MPLEKMSPPKKTVASQPSVCVETLYLLQDIVHSAPATLYRLNLPDTSVAAFISPNIQETLGVTFEPPNSTEAWVERIHANDVDNALSELATWIKTSEQRILKREYRVRDDSGRYRWVADTAKKKFVNNEAVAIIGCIADISASRIEHERIKKIAAVSPGVIYQLKQSANEHFSFPYISDKVTEVYVVPKKGLVDDATPVFDRIHREDIKMVFDTLAFSKANLTEWNCDYRIVVNGVVRWLSGTAMPEQTVDGAVLWSGVATDVTQQKNIEEELRQLSFTDSLTRLANRRHFMLEAERLIIASRRHGRPFSMLMYDLDHFKRVNDTYGHEVGDQVLVKISELVQGRMRACDMVARIGGEEFVVLLPDTELNAAKRVAEELRKSIAALNFEANGETFKITVTFGVTRYNATDRAPDDILRRVDKLMYEGKQGGRNRVVAAT
ncbi:sensor domain-containing diguanylate cyclase [Aliidiomarina quisquiliarum]|uniref:sensor domain-containing diguanylate cyclase n=1 Tax=Aliidiomarina quisquiliarum TaxID=2938947 RepID=UPI00208E1CB1|nr:sensor domain-containing diguanylate cyclase [Aliidiomarina quisquiliarum]MCO4320412.1 diguanylate cyclase [Aliidiomarina quisquiliarum]